MQDVAIKFNVIGLYNKIFVAINSKYFNDNFNAMIYIYIYIYIFLHQTIYYFEYLVTISYYFTKFIRLQIIDQNKSD